MSGRGGAPAPPRFARRLLERALPVDVREDICGDLEEVFRARCARDGVWRARLWYWGEAVAFSGRFLWERLRERLRERRGRGAAPGGASAPGAVGSGALRERRAGQSSGSGRVTTPGRGRVARRMGVGFSWLDVKLGFRMLVKYPGLTLVGGLAISIAVAIGAAWFEFSSDYWRPTLPLEDGDRIVGIQNWDVAAGVPQYRSLHDFVLWRAELESVEELGAYRTLERNLITEDGRSEPVRGAYLSASAFRMARVPPLLGRPLAETDERAGAPSVVVLGYGLWQRRFGGDPGIIGRTIQLGSTVHTVVGVMPEGFTFPVNHNLWVPFRLNAADYERGQGPRMRVFGRLAPGVTLEEAQAELTAIGLRAAADHPETHEHLRPRIASYVASFYGRAPWQLYLVDSFFIMILVVACANVATLVFARTATREGEMAVRSALGASRGRIVTQLFTETLVLAAVAAAVGLAVVRWGQGWGMAIFWGVQGAPAARPFWWDYSLAWTTVLYAGGLAVLGAGIAGIVPALKVTGRRVRARLQRAGAGGSGLRFGRLSTGVIVTQVALSVFLLPEAIFGGLEALRYQAAEAGFPANEYLSFRLEMDWETLLTDATERARFLAEFEATYQELERRLVAEPGVTGVTFGSRLPGMKHPRRQIEVDGMATPAGGDLGREVSTAAVDVDFFGAFGTPILAGRAFNSGDLASGRRAVIVNQSFVHQILGDQNPVGRRIRYVRPPDEEPGPWSEIVGVVKDLAVNPYTPEESVVLYRPLAPGGGHPVHVAVHVGGDAGSFAPRLRRLAAAVDPSLRLYELLPLDEVGRGEELGNWFWVSVLALVASVALLLSAAGIYSLMSFTVSQRTREIGIRAALGADPRRIVTSIFSRAAAQIGLGIVVGGAGAVFLNDQVATAGSGPLLLVAAIMMSVGLLACVVPARRALRIQPTEALKEGG